VGRVGGQARVLDVARVCGALAALRGLAGQREGQPQQEAAQEEVLFTHGAIFLLVK
jgi:hypothetical protein